MAIVGPVYWLGIGSVEVFDKAMEFISKIHLARKVAIAHDSFGDHAKDDFNLIQPRTVFRNEQEADPMTRVG